jgi:hydroxypyruvate isomerase
MPRFAANLTMMFGEWSFLDRFAAAADAGFEAVEFLFPYEHAPQEIADRLKANGLEIALFNMPPGDWAAGDRGMAVFSERRAEFEAGVAKAMEYALATGVRRLHMMAGIAPPGAPQAGASYRQAIRFACAAAAPHGVDILLEPLNGRDMPGYFLNDFNQAAALIAELALPNLKLQFDIYHRQRIHGEVIMGLTEMMPIIGHVQTASVPLRHEPGSGELSDFAVFAALDRLGYAGHVGCEYRPAAGTLAGLGWRERVGRDGA